MSGEGVVSEILKQKLRKTQGREPSPQAVKRTSICLPEPLYKSLKAYAAVEGLKLNALMVELLREGLKKRLENKDLQKQFESL